MPESQSKKPRSCINPRRSGWNEYSDCGSCEYCDEENREKSKRDRIKKIGLKAFNEFDFDKFKVHPQNEKAFQRCKDFDFEKNNLYIHGKCGTGKSHLAYSVMNKFDIYSFEVVKQTELIRKFRGQEAEDEEKLILFYSGVRILFIDDLGIGRSTEFANQILYEIIDKRIMNCKNGLIITSNLSLDDISVKMDDDRLASRIAGLCEVIEIAGIDGRLR